MSEMPDDEGVTTFTAFTGFHPTDHENCQDGFVPPWTPGGGGCCVFAVTAADKGGEGSDALETGLDAVILGSRQSLSFAATTAGCCPPS